MRNNSLSHVIYDLKRRFGVRGDYYHVSHPDITVDVATGNTSIVKTVYHSKRMIELPSDITRDMKIGGSSFPSGNQEVNVVETTILIDHDDLPLDFVYSPDDYIILYSKIRRVTQPGRRFNVQRIATLEDNSIVMVVAKFITGSPLYAIHDLPAKDALSLTEVTVGGIL